MLQGVDLPVHLVDGEVEDLRVAVDGRLERLVAVRDHRELRVLASGSPTNCDMPERPGQVAHEAAHLLAGGHVVLGPARRDRLAAARPGAAATGRLRRSAVVHASALAMPRGAQRRRRAIAERTDGGRAGGDGRGHGTARGDQRAPEERAARQDRRDPDTASGSVSGWRGRGAGVVSRMPAMLGRDACRRRWTDGPKRGPLVTRDW